MPVITQCYTSNLIINDATYFLLRAAVEENAFNRMKKVVKWYISGFYKKPKVGGISHAIFYKEMMTFAFGFGQKHCYIIRNLTFVHRD